MDNIINKIKLHSKNIRKNMLDIALEAGSNSSHFGGGLSTVEILSSLYGYKMNYDNKNTKSEARDRFILSKGHGCLSYYCALVEFGFISKSDLMSFEKFDSNFLGHPVMNKDIGIEFSTGSLGMGLSLGIGCAIAATKKKINFNTYVIIGDGECNEGSIWESALFASSFKLNNLTVILDHNKYQQTGSLSEIVNSNSLSEKWAAFGWDVIEIDGHNINQILNAFNLKQDKPKIIVANTIKGKGFSFSESNNDWHHAVLTKNFYEKGLIELENNEN